MKVNGSRLALAGRRGLVLGAATALVAGVSIAPMANAEEAGVGSLLDSVISTITSGSVEQGLGPAGQEQGPKVTLSKSVVSEDGEHQITVTGTGFKDDSVLATRPPLAGKNPGVYVVLGKFAEKWQPSEGVESTDRKGIQTFWAVNAEDMQTIGGDARGAIEMAADGSFTATFTVDKSEIDEVAGPEGSKLGIYTYPGGGAKHAAWETFSPITFGDESPVFGSVDLGSLTGLLHN